MSDFPVTTSFEPREPCFNYGNGQIRLAPADQIGLGTDAKCGKICERCLVKLRE